MKSYKIEIFFKSGSKSETIFRTKKEALSFIKTHSGEKSIVSKFKLYERITVENEIEL